MAPPPNSWWMNSISNKRGRLFLPYSSITLGTWIPINLISTIPFPFFFIICCTISTFRMPGSRCPSFMVDNYNSWQWKSLVVVFLPLDSPDLLFLEYSQCINTHKKNVYIFFLKKPWLTCKKRKAAWAKLMGQWQQAVLQTSLCSHVCILHGWLYAMCLMAGHNGRPVTQNQLKESERGKGGGERRGMTGEERKWNGHRWETGLGSLDSWKRFEAKTFDQTLHGGYQSITHAPATSLVIASV